MLLRNAGFDPDRTGEQEMPYGFRDPVIKQPRSEAAEILIGELRGQVDADTSSSFNRRFLAEIEGNPGLTIRQCWEIVEGQSASQARTGMKRYPFTFDN